MLLLSLSLKEVAGCGYEQHPSDWLTNCHAQLSLKCRVCAMTQPDMVNIVAMSSSVEADMEPYRFSTGAFHQRDQKSAWSDWFQPVFDVYPEDPGQPGFKAEYSTWDLGCVTMTRVSGPASRTVRKATHLSHSPIDHWVVTYYRDGSTALSTGGGHLDARAGVPFVWSLGQPSESWRTVADRLQLYFPRDSFSRLGASLDMAVGSMLDTSLGHLLGNYMLLLERELPNLKPADVSRLSTAVEAMLGACLAPSADRIAAAKRQIRLTLMERVRQAVRKHLRSPSLGPDKLCREAATSRSQLYRLLEGEGGVAHYIQRQRLSESFAILCDNSNVFSINAIAEALCFSDASSFTRAFRREFGMRPSDVRVASQAGLPPAAMARNATEHGNRRFADCLRTF
jgi:AraC-like DNA-binding protein